MVVVVEVVEVNLFTFSDGNRVVGDDDGDMMAMAMSKYNWMTFGKSLSCVPASSYGWEWSPPQTTPHHDGHASSLRHSSTLYRLSIAMLVQQTNKTKKEAGRSVPIKYQPELFAQKVIITYSKVCGAGDGKAGRGSQLNVGLMLTAQTACFPA